MRSQIFVKASLAVLLLISPAFTISVDEATSLYADCAVNCMSDFSTMDKCFDNCLTIFDKIDNVDGEVQETPEYLSLHSQF